MLSIIEGKNIPVSIVYEKPDEDEYKRSLVIPITLEDVNEELFKEKIKRLDLICKKVKDYNNQEVIDYLIKNNWFYFELLKVKHVYIFINNEHEEMLEYEKSLAKSFAKISRALIKRYKDAVILC